MFQSTIDTSSSPSRAGSPMTSISVILPFAIVKRSALHQSSLRRHHDADGPIHERGLREPRQVPVGDRPLRPDRRAADLGRRAGRHVRANHEIRIEDGEQAFEVAAA